MKILKKVLPMLLSVMLLLAALPANADAKTYEEKAGSQVTVEIPVTKGFGGEGTVVFSNDSLFTSIEISGENVGSFQEYDNNIAFANSSEIKDGSINVTVTISSSAKDGDSCKISVSGYEYVDADDNMVPSALESQTVVIKTASSSSQDETDTEKDPTTGGDSTVVDHTDYSELEECIQIAEGLSSDKYTAESWAALMEALQLLYDARGCGDQAQVDAAVQAFRDAFAGLVEMDYSKLIAAIEEGEATIGSDELASLISDLVKLLLEGEELLSSNDQAAVDAKAAEIMAIIEQIKALLGAGEDVQDEPGNAEPEGEYCNIPIHKVWPILFFISLALNIVLIILLVSRKKKEDEKKDDTPMVDYQIGDDDK